VEERRLTDATKCGDRTDDWSSCGGKNGDDGGHSVHMAKGNSVGLEGGGLAPGANGVRRRVAGFGSSMMACWHGVDVVK
jgi:hypothetical protein